MQFDHSHEYRGNLFSAKISCPTALKLHCKDKVEVWKVAKVTWSNMHTYSHSHAGVNCYPCKNCPCSYSPSASPCQFCQVTLHTIAPPPPPQEPSCTFVLLRLINRKAISLSFLLSVQCLIER